MTNNFIEYFLRDLLTFRCLKDTEPANRWRANLLEGFGATRGAHGVVKTSPIPHRSILPPTYTHSDPPGTPPALPAPLP